MVGSSERQLNYSAGINTVVLPIDHADQPRVYVLTPPVGESLPLTSPEKAELSITGVDQVGNYRVGIAGEQSDRYGFSVNLPARLRSLPG